MEITRLAKIKEILDKLGVPSFRLNQAIQAVYIDGISDFSRMHTLPQNIREMFQNEMGDVLTLRVVNKVEDDQTTKILFETRDGAKIETVKMVYKSEDHPEEDHITYCVSSQSGCGMGCTFCATGAMGFNKNLTVDEIVDQVLYFRQIGEVTPANVVFMGMGEPFANPNIFEALHTLTKTMGIGYRRISVSTVGLVPGINRFTKEFPQVNLAFSLHSSFNEERLALMPVTKTFPIDDVMKALNNHIKVTNKKVFIAYLLMAGVNDSSRHAKALCSLIKAQGSKSYLYHVNLIKYHVVDSASFERPTFEAVEEFRKILEKNGISVTLRQSFGGEIDAACGQLAGTSL